MFLSLPCAPEVYFRYWNLLEDYLSQANAYLTDIRQVRGREPSRTIAFNSLLTRPLTLGPFQLFAPPRTHSHWQMGLKAQYKSLSFYPPQYYIA